MSHTNTTTNYGLPQFLSSDKPAWMADINVAFADIDSQMKTNADAASAAQTTADDAVLNGAPGYSNLSTYSVGDVVNYLGRVYKCDIAVTTPEAFDNAKWSYYRLSDASAQIDVIDSEIGSTDISGIADGTLTGAVDELNSNLTGLDTNDVPITASPNIIFTAKTCKAGIVTLQGQVTSGESVGPLSIGIITDSKYYPIDNSYGRNGWLVGNGSSVLAADFGKIGNFLIQNSNGDISAYANQTTSGGYLFTFTYQAQGN